jgi:hypothetical protein
MKRLPLLFCLLLTACGVGGLPSLEKPSGKITVQPDTVYMGADGWVFSYSPNMPTHPTASGKGWTFDFPNRDGVHMLLVPYRAEKPHTTLTITYRITAISGTPKFVSVDPGSGGAAAFRPMLKRVGDQMLATQEFFRWWSTPVILVADGKVHTVSWPLTPDKWTAVFGRSNATEFAATWKGNLMAVGVSYGGDFAAHGVLNTGGVARFEMINYQIQ